VITGEGEFDLSRLVGSAASGKRETIIAPEPGDRRFAAKVWQDDPYYDYLKQSYLLAARYLEELVELTKLLVGVNAFRSGLLERPQYKDYVQQARTAEAGLQKLTSRRSARSSHHAAEADRGVARFRRAAAMVSSVQKFRQTAETQRAMHHAEEAEVPETAVVDEDEEDDGIPMSLRRVGTRLQREYTVSKRRRYTSSSRRDDS
jgi:hypothetical protein